MRAGSLLGSEGGCRWTARACHTSAALLAAPGFPGPCAGLCARAQVCSATHTHTSARKQLSLSTCMHGHNFRRQVRTKSTEEAAHRGRASQPPVRTQTQRQLKAGAPTVLRVQAQEKGWRNIQEQREGKSSPPCSPRARSAALLTPATVRAQMGAPSERAALLMTKLLARSRRGSGMQVTEYETDSRVHVDSVHDSLHTHTPTYTTAGGEEITID